MDQDPGRLPEMRQGALPAQPELALFVATLFERLGGTLEIDARGRRRTRRPNRELLEHQGPPQLADAKPWESFASLAEWEGAMKLAEYWLARLGKADRDLVFTMLAPLPLHRTDGFDFRSQL